MSPRRRSSFVVAVRRRSSSSSFAVVHFSPMAPDRSPSFRPRRIVSPSPSDDVEKKTANEGKKKNRRR